MNVIALAIRQPVTVAVGVILVLLAGVISLTRLPISLTPNVESTVVTVTTTWIGASPQEVEQNLVDKQEERLIGLSNLSQMTSTSAQSTGTIRLEFNTGTDKEAALREVSDKLRQVPEYPENVDEPIIEATDRENRDYIAWIVFGTTDPEFDIRTMRDFAVDRIEPILERVEGMAEINVLGGRELEVQIIVDPVRLAQYGITPSEFARLVQDTNQNVSAGQVADGKRDIRLRTVGQYQNLAEIRDTVVVDDQRGTVLVRDVADVTLAYAEPTSFVRSKGQSVIAINAQGEIGSNVMSVMDGLRAQIDALNAPGGLLDAEAKRLGLNGELTLRQVYDQTSYIDDAIALVRSNIWIGGTLAIFVLILFLRSVRSVGIIAMAIPISIIGAVVAMVALGRSINVISLAGMAFAVGMVVDNAIVVLENIYRHLELGKKPTQAAYDGAREVWGAVLASTLTTVAVFVPILLVEEEAGQLFRDIALAICAAVTLSLLVSITLIPTLGARLLKPLSQKKRRSKHVVATFVGKMIYLLTGSWVARLAIIAVLTVASVIGTIVLMPPADYLPVGNRNLVFGLIIPPPGYNIEHFDLMATRIEETVKPFWEAGNLIEDQQAYEQAIANLPQIPKMSWGGGPPEMITPPTLDNYFLVNFGSILFHGGVSDDPTRIADVPALFNHATRAEAVPGVIAFPFQVPLFRLGGSTGSAIKLQLSGPDLDDVIAAASVVYQTLGSDPDIGYQKVQPEPSNFNLATPELHVKPDLVRLSELGLTTTDIGLAVRAGGDGAIVDEYQLGGETIDLKIISRDAITGESVNSLGDTPVATPGGQIVPLSSIAQISDVRGPSEIARVARQRAVSFQVTPGEEQPLEQVISKLEGIVDDLKQRGVISPSIRVSMAGSASKLEDVQRALLGDGSFVSMIASSLFLALVVVYLLMCVLFQSFVQPIVIMISVPLATLGGFLALFAVYIWSVGDPYMPVQKLDVLTMLGFVILIGVVVNNAILIVHQANHFMAGFDGDPLSPRKAISESVKSRVRPIFMSTMTSIGGMAPLVLMPGAGSELYRGLGSVVVGGLLVSTIFTIVLVPMLLSVVIDMRGWFKRSSERENSVTTPAAAGVIAK